MRTKIINLIIGAGWHEGELSVADDIMLLYATEIETLKRKLRESENELLKATTNKPVVKSEETLVEVIPHPHEFLQIFSITTQREMFFNNMITRNWAVEAIEGYVSSYYNIKKQDDEGIE